jgi:hypothetical protein
MKRTEYNNNNNPKKIPEKVGRKASQVRLLSGKCCCMAETVAHSKPKTKTKTKTRTKR